MPGRGRPRKTEPGAKSFADLTEAELQALEGEARRRVELERAQLVADAQDAANIARELRETAAREAERLA